MSEAPITDLRVRLTGGFGLDGIDLDAIRSRKNRVLLKVLALGRGRAVGIDRLIDAVWGDDLPTHPERDLAVLVSRARTVVGRDAIPRSDAGYRLAAAWFDLGEAERLAGEGASLLVAGSAPGAAAAAGAGLRLIRGPVLADEPDAPWAAEERAAGERLVLRLRDIAGQAALACGDPASAAELAEAALEGDPYDEAALRLLMTAHVRAGRPGSARAAYAKVRERLAEDLGADPSAETEALHSAVVRSEPIPIAADVVGTHGGGAGSSGGLGPRVAALGLVQAAEQSAAGYDLRRARRLVDEAVSHHDTAYARLVRGRLRAALGDFDGADVDAVAAQAGGLTAHALELRAWIARYRRDAEAAVRLGRAGAELATDPETRASCLLVTGLGLRNQGDLVAADVAVTEAARLAGPAAAGFLGLLRVQQGRADEALDLLEPGLGSDLGLAHGMPAEHMLQAAAHAHGLLGQPARALDLLDRLDLEAERRGTWWRYRGLAANYRGWILRNLGDATEADEENTLATEDDNAEQQAQSALDLADGALRRCDVDGAGRWLGAATEILEGSITNRYRVEQRWGVLAARRALLAGEPVAALEYLGPVADATERRRDARYQAIGALLAARARRRLGEPVDPSLLQSVVDRLGRVAGLEAWWYLGEAAQDFGMAAWRKQAQGYAAALAAEAGARAIDETALNEFVHRFAADLAATLHAATVCIGDKLGLYRALAAGGPQTAAELAERSGCRERYVAEWLCAQAASGYCEYDPTTERFHLNEVQAACLADESSPAFLAGGMLVAASVVKDEDRVRDAFLTGAGVPWSDHHHDLFEGTLRFFRPGYVANLVENWLPALDGVVDRLRGGIRVADVGCGYGASTILMAQAFPESTFVGFDNHGPAVEEARKAAADAGVSDRVSFEVASAQDYPGEGYGLVCIFDALHDMGDPVGAAAHIRRSLDADGTWLLVEPQAGDRLEDNLNLIGRSSTRRPRPSASPMSARRTGAGPSAPRPVRADSGTSPPGPGSPGCAAPARRPSTRSSGCAPEGRDGGGRGRSARVRYAGCTLAPAMRKQTTRDAVRP